LTRWRTGVAALAAAVVLQVAPLGGPGHSTLQAHASGSSPVVSGISPNNGSGSANSQVTIYGSGFTGATGVRFGTVGCVNFYLGDDRHITAFVPVGTAGTTVDVHVIGPGGTSAASAADQFTYVAATVPSVNGVSPNSGPAAGQTGVTIVGSGFSTTTRVSFGSVGTAYFYASDDSHMYVQAPPGTAGSTVDVRVVDTAGTSSATLADHYMYLAGAAPSVRALLPNHGPAAGGTGVQILGHGLAGATVVHFGTVAAAINYAYADDNIYVRSPPGTAGTTVDVTVTTPLGTSPAVAVDGFSYTVATTPRINAISPNRGNAAGGASAEVFGSGFAGATGVQFGTVAASFSVFDDGDLSVTAPAGTAGSTVDVSVTSPAGTSSLVVQDRYTYLGSGTPEVDAVTPNRGPAAGGTSVTIIGSGLFSPIAVKFGTIAATVSSASPDGTAVTATSPGGTAGTTVDIVVTTSAGSSPIGARDRFSYLSASSSTPTVNALDPNHGSQRGGTALQIHGSGFTTTGTTVLFGTTSTTNFSVTSPDVIYVYYTPAGTPGTTVDVTVSTAAGTSAVMAADRYTFDAVAAPVITAVSPNNAPAGAAVYISGPGVGSATTISFGSTAASVISFFGVDNVVEVRSPPGTAGSTVDVRVTNPAGTSAITTADQFTYSSAPIPVPTVSGIGPGSGTASGGTTVYISGSGFSTGITAVNFGTAPASSFYAPSDNLIQARTPAHAVGSVDVTVANASGTSTASSADTFVFTTPPVPSVTNVSPSGGPSNGGPTVYISGSGLTGATSVSFGGTSGAGFTVTSDGLITVYHSPAQGTNPSTVDITVTTPGGTSGVSTADRFTFGAPIVPTVSAVSPNTGPAAGGTTAYITGTGFTSPVSVKFGATVPSFFTVISDTLISTISPAQGTNPSTVDVTVTSGGGTSATTTADQFTWGSTPPPTGPVVNAVSPNQGPTAGGTSVTIYGSGLSGATAVNFGTVPGIIQYGSGTQIVVHSPAESAGTVDITVTTGAGTSATSAADHFTYPTPTAPVVNAVDPNHGTTFGGGSIILYGHGFTGATSVHFGTMSADNFYVGSDTYLYVNQLPAGTAGTVDVTITSPAGTSATSGADQYTYVAPGTPAVYYLWPNRGTTLGGTGVTIYGSGLAGATSVSFGTSAAQFSTGYQSDSQLYTWSPAGAAGTVDVTVVTGVGTSATQAADRFTFVTPGPPVVNAVAPNRGSSGGGTSVHLIGSNFTNATTVSFGGASTSFSVTGDSDLYATSPSTAAGTVDIVATTPFGTSTVSLADKFTFFTPPVPVVTAVSPNSGSAAGGTLVFISGSGFTGATSLLFGNGCEVIGVSASDNLIETPTPPGTAGSTVDIQVITPGGTSATGAADRFTYTAATPPVVTVVGPSSGPSVGQTTVYITGTDIVGATGVSFGAVPALYFYPYYSYPGGPSSTLLIAVSPPGTTGATVDITVTTPAGVSSISAADQFTYTATAAPAVTAVSPNSGPFAGGDGVFVTGSGLLGASAVHFGTQLARPGQAATNRGPISRNPSSAGRVGSPAIMVRLPITERVSEQAKPAPTRYAIVPIPLAHSGARQLADRRSTGPSRALPQIGAPHAPASGATGLRTTPAQPSQLGCGGPGPVFCPGFNALDDNVIFVFRAPAGTNGSTVDVTVSSPVGTSAISTADHYTYGPTPAPTVSALSPTNGPFGGGTDVLITGTNFTTATSVKFGTAPASFFAYGDNVIDATSPAGTNGAAVDVTVTNPGGTSAVSTNDRFSYGATPTPVVSIVRPASGPGGTSVSITGTGFTGATSVQFGATTLSRSTWFVQSDNLIQATAPAGASGAVVDVTVTTPGGTSVTSTADQYTFSATPAPVVTIISPNSGPTTGATTVYITGTGFNGASTVNFGATAATGMFVISDTLIQTTSPAGSGAVDVRVVGLGGTSASTTGDVFSYGTPSAPTVTGVIPNNGPVGGGTAVTILGANLAGATAVHFGTVAAPVMSTSPGQVTTTSPAGGGPGIVEITVTTGGGTSAANVADQFTYGNTLTRISTRQYQLTGSDGATWVDMDPAGNLTLTIVPATSLQVILTGNADLWTASAGYNQDIGIDVNGAIAAWKESGGFAGTFSPNAAFVQTEVSMAAGTTYTVKLRWKTNKNAAGATIYAGAGPIGGQFSPTRLTARIVTTTAPIATSTQQYTLTNSNGATWMDMDTTNLSLTLTPAANSTAVIGGNSDLWTSTAAYNQDIAITINGAVAAWKESGGFAGTYSPNAAYVQTVQSLTAGTTYTIKLQWKTNKNAAGATIWAGAGPINGQYSPTSLLVQLFPAATSLQSKVSAQQYTLTSSDGSTWADMDGAGNLTMSVTPTVNSLAVITGNSDLWTSSAGYNQDIGIDVNGTIVAWKESGGFAGTFSPNAAYVQAVIPMNAGTTYTIKMRWKTNKAAPGATIWAGAGPIGTQYSPTSLTIQFAS
jgi:hypothetical protein